MEHSKGVLGRGNRIMPLTIILATAIIAQLSLVSATFFKAFNVTYDHRALIIDGQRRILISAGIHYPRATPEMWPYLIEKSKNGGVDVIQSYVFWNAHEPIRGQYNFDDRYDLVKFVKLVAASGLFFHLRIGPYVCAEWNFGGFPVWLRDIPGIEFRTNNSLFKNEMKRFVNVIVNLMREELLFSWQGGPIILLQIENEYGDVEGSYGESGKEYMKWAAKMAIGLGAGVPWVMCKQTDAPKNIIDACNGYYCDGFKPNSYSKPVLWTEDWDGWYTKWGDSLPHRPVEDLAFAVARFFQRGGSFQNYYMYFGGTNFGRTSGGPFYITSYDYDAPIDEYGLLSEPKWGHLKNLHAALKLCEPALVSVDSPRYIKLGQYQEAHVYNSTTGDCSAFLANIDSTKAVTLKFYGQQYTLLPWSVSILPDCRNVVLNTAKVTAQMSVKSAESLSSSSLKLRTSHEEFLKMNSFTLSSSSWMALQEPIELWSNQSFTINGLMEHLNVTKDQSDYLWYFTRLEVSDEDITFWEENMVKPVVDIDSMRDIFHVFVNGQLAGSTVGHWVKVVQTVQFQKGVNELVLLSETVGLQNYGAFLERDGGGLKGLALLTGFKDGNISLSNLSWTYQVGLKGEILNYYKLNDTELADWQSISAQASPFTWYKTYFDAPTGFDPVVLDLQSMGKGQAWVNGHHIGRYWTLVASKNDCATCDYRGAYDSGKCRTNCGKPTQTLYHVPRSWLQESDNLLVIFEENGGNPLAISIKTLSTRVICAQVSEYDYPPIQSWSIATGSVTNNKSDPEVNLHCEEGHVISSIEFASYGTPNGGCQEFSIGNCHAMNSTEIVSQACQGRNECNIPVSNTQFGDPCRGVVKKLAVEAKCISLSASFAQF